jgi:hypothetical protein
MVAFVGRSREADIGQDEKVIPHGRSLGLYVG